MVYIYLPTRAITICAVPNHLISVYTYAVLPFPISHPSLSEIGGDRGEPKTLLLLLLFLLTVHTCIVLYISIYIYIREYTLCIILNTIYILLSLRVNVYNYYSEYVDINHEITNIEYKIICKSVSIFMLWKRYDKSKVRNINPVRKCT